MTALCRFLRAARRETAQADSVYLERYPLHKQSRRRKPKAS
ncbi:hypothetical protein USDA257_c02640 [Sinorhizobium fredii USDA 257]|uniref:Uncharacterized protein n=1 Tax=Sinorhizobium fredii (strain USDA 257) TaxID=1185652 RepID=I3WZ06_SINF2|nr:hypothetical protein USDA257_c02640 [Sinorhizobium fredii USDA 257]